MEKGRLAIESALDDNACARNSASAHRQTHGGSLRASERFCGGRIKAAALM